jgi:hypothetical protein
VGEGLAVLVAVGDCFGVSVAVGDCFLVTVRVGVGVADEVVFVTVRVAEGVALSEALSVLVLVADADGRACDLPLADVGVFAGFVGYSVSVFVGVCDGVAAGLDVSVRVGADDGSDGVVPELVVPDGDGLADWLALALLDFVGAGLVVASVGVLAVGAGVLAV